MSLFEYKDLRIDQALRTIFKSCNIPGEAQVIDRVVSMFAHAYFTENNFIKDESAAYVLSFSIILLNTDLHTDSIKTKMPLKSYIRNLKGVNGGEDFDEAYLESLYDSIKADPIEAKEVIRAIDNHDLADMTNKWGKILLRSKNIENYWMINELLRQPAGENEKLMFELLWESGLLGTLTSAVECAITPQAIAHLSSLFIECSKVAAYFNMKEYIHKLMSILCHSFIRNTDSIPQLCYSPRAFYILDAAVGSAMVAQDYLASAWSHLINCLLRLHKLKLLPNKLIELDDFVDEQGNALPMSTSHLDETFFQYFRSNSCSQSASVKSDEEPIEETGGIWASFVKYLGVPSHGQKTNEEIMQEMIVEAKEKVLTSGIHVLFSNSKKLEIESLNNYILALIQKCKNETEDISVVLCIELLTSSVLANNKRMPEEMWKNVLDCLQGMICMESYSWTSERALVNLIRITVLHHEDCVRIRNTLQSVLNFMSLTSLKKFSKFAERLVAGLGILLSQGNAHFLYASENWTTMLKLLENFIGIDRTVRTGFELLSALLTHFEKNKEISIELYENLLEIVKVHFKSESPDPVFIGKSTEIAVKLFKIVSTRFNLEVVCAYWKKVIGELGKLCQSNKHFVRIASYTALQETILSYSKHELWQTWRECFEKVLFPLVIEPFMITKEMLKGVSEEKSKIMKQEYETTRERATSLVCHTTLNILPIITSASDFNSFWLRLVKLLSQTLKYKNDVNERSYELIKNLFLIVKNENVVSEELWAETWTVVNLEDLKAELVSPS